MHGILPTPQEVYLQIADAPMPIPSSSQKHELSHRLAVALKRYYKRIRKVRKLRFRLQMSIINKILTSIFEIKLKIYLSIGLWKNMSTKQLLSKVLLSRSALMS